MNDNCSPHVNGVCIDEKKVWACQEEFILLETPCNGTCPVGTFLTDGKCTHEFWKCFGSFQPLTTPCAGNCFSDSFCLRNQTCMKIQSGISWSCDGSCVNLESAAIPCDRQCPNSKERYPSTYLNFPEALGCV